MPVAITTDNVIDAINAILLAHDSTALLIPQNLLGIEDGEDTNVFQSPADNNLVHAWMFWQSGGTIARAKGDAIAYTSNHAARTRRAEKTWVFTIKLYRELASGNDAANSSRQVSALVNTVQNAFFALPKLDLNNENLRQHNNLQMLSSRVVPSGTKKVHIVVCRLDVEVWESIAPTPGHI